jgi:hypothetical protein
MSAAATALRKGFAGLREALGLARDELGGVRSEVASLKADLELEQSRPLPLAVVERRVDATIARLRAHAAARLSVAGALVMPVGGDAEHALHSSGVAPFAVAALVDPDALRRWLMHEAETALQRLPEPATDEVREVRLLELRCRLAAAERRESDLCWQSFDNGLDPGWRADLDPAAVLGLDP